MIRGERTHVVARNSWRVRLSIDTLVVVVTVILVVEDAPISVNNTSRGIYIYIFLPQ